MNELFFIGLWGAVGLAYLSNAHQRLLAVSLPAGPARLAALGLAAIAIATGWHALGAAVACFAGLAWALLWAGLWPLAGALPWAHAAGRKEACR
ncbi:hypothetical protein H5407_11955 [Mitsuaria sp. WAJ17]|uniref:hypothetical protein n=1 Tax=Mitsuaria sp. WAJ17 TaxID=2761452 RepID=UPI00160254AA|nr:hypothetical protein [Mitsuaria sp. WAJ17]MBB2485934.1 hypothetical protein [Mitsuaria sp. WAJ17]